MWKREHSKLHKNVSKENVWKIWTDIDNWTDWHDDLDYCRLEGPFAEGSTFLLKPKGVKELRIEITEVNEGISFTDCTRFFGARMYDTHSLEETSEGLILKNTLTVSGPLKWLWVKLVAREVADTVPQENETLVKLARECHV